MPGTLGFSRCLKGLPPGFGCMARTPKALTQQCHRHLNVVMASAHAEVSV